MGEAPGWRVALGLEGGAQFGEQGRAELFRFEAHENGGEQAELMGRYAR